MRLEGSSGGGGFAINLGGAYEALEIEGRENLRVWDPRWPELVHEHLGLADES